MPRLSVLALVTQSCSTGRVRRHSEVRGQVNLTTTIVDDLVDLNLREDETNES